MKIYTKTGDDGTTGLFGGRRLPKHHPRIAAYGDVDELNATLGVARSVCSAGEIDSALEKIQHTLFVCGADLATPLETKFQSVPRIATSDTLWLEGEIDSLEKNLTPLKEFILPGGSTLASQLHVARNVCRRAERSVTFLAESETLGEVPVYLNRLSDYLFVLARYANSKEGKSDVVWKK